MYWICADKIAVAHKDAAKSCDTAGMALASFASIDEEHFLARLLSAPAWIGRPSSGKVCRALDHADGTVIEAACGTKLGFVCQFKPRAPSEVRLAVIGADARPCVDADAAGFSATKDGRPGDALAAFERQLADAKKGQPAGLAAHPPAAGSVCAGSPASLPCDEVELCRCS